VSFRLFTYNPERPKPASFYIQSKGDHAGRPLREPIPNCFGIVTSDPLLFARIYSLYKGQFFRCHIIGTVIPFLRIKDAKDVIATALRCPSCELEKELTAISTIDTALTTLRAKMASYEQMQLLLCRKVNGQIR